MVRREHQSWRRDDHVAAVPANIAVSGVQDILGVYVGTTSTPTQTANSSVSEFQMQMYATRDSEAAKP